MTAIAIVFVIISIVLGYTVYILNKKVGLLRGLLQQTIPYLKKAGLNFDALQPFLNPNEWEFVKKGGDTQPGINENFGLCPCQKEYTVNTRQTNHKQMPNQGQIANCLNNPPPPDPPGLKCAEDCIPVMTHIWHGWMVMKNTRTGQFRLNCHTFAQYHCKKPADPAVEQDPMEGPPPPEVEA